MEKLSINGLEELLIARPPFVVIGLIWWFQGPLWKCNLSCQSHCIFTSQIIRNTNVGAIFFQLVVPQKSTSSWRTSLRSLPTPSSLSAESNPASRRPRSAGLRMPRRSTRAHAIAPPTRTAWPACTSATRTAPTPAGTAVKPTTTWVEWTPPPYSELQVSILHMLNVCAYITVRWFCCIFCYLVNQF